VKEFKIQIVNFEGGTKKKSPADAPSNLVLAYTNPKDVLQETTLFSVIKIFKLET